MSAVYWTTWGPARGACGHHHRSPETARRCVEQDQRDVAAGHPASGLDRPYSDRAVYMMPADVEPAEAGRAGWRQGEP